MHVDQLAYRCGIRMRHSGRSSLKLSAMSPMAVGYIVEQIMTDFPLLEFSHFVSLPLLFDDTVPRFLSQRNVLLGQ